jgi:putative SOS response-associated peptidase YedK
MFEKERFGNDCAGTARRDGPDPGEQDLWSFAALTDEPRPEIAETGHQRCVIALQQPSLREWLSPVGVSRERLNAILGQREAAYYKHQIAA